MTKPESSIISTPAKVLSILVMIAIPFLIIVLIEIGLRFFDYGGNLDLFVRDKIGGKEYYVLNKNFTKRYFFKKGIEAPTPRSQMFSAQKDSNTYRIFCLGGSSTLGTPYPPNAAFPAMLRHILTSLHPNRKFEVVNCGVTAITTHSVLDMGREILHQYQPDLLIVYSGHNEFYGVFGQASRLFLFDNQAFVQAFLRLQRFRFFRLLKDAYINLFVEKITGKDVIDPATLMGTVAKEAEIPFGNEIFRKTEEHYRQNIEALVELAQQNQADIVLCNLVSNLRGLAPFQSLHSQSINMVAAEKVEALAEEAKKLIAEKNIQAAIEILDEALELDSAYAELHFLFGQCVKQQGQYEIAKSHFKLAIDYDVIRFRAPSSFNRIVNRIAVANRIPSINIEKAFSENSPNGIVGNNLILEHIHPNNEGYFLLAKTIAKGMADANLISTRWDWSRQRSDSAYIAMSKLSPLSHAVVNAGMRRLTSHWPFTLNEDKREIPKIGDELTERLAEEFVSRGGGNLIQLHLSLGAEYLSQDESGKALAEFKAALAIEPDCEAHNQLGLFHAQKAEMAINERENQKALQFYQKAQIYFSDGLAVCPEDVNLNYNLGRLYSLTKMESEKARDAFEKVLQIEPNNKAALLQMSNFYLRQKEYKQAEIYLKRGIDSHPNEADFYFNLAAIYLNENKLTQAEDLLTRVLKINPRSGEGRRLLKEIQARKKRGTGKD